MILIFFTLEDFFWFILNPHYKITGINKGWWHHKIGYIPILYIAFPIISLLLTYSVNYHHTFLKSMVTILIGMITVIVISPLYHMFL